MEGFHYQYTVEGISENFQERSQSRITAFPRHQKKDRWGTKMTKQTPHMKPQLTNKEELQQRNRLGTAIIA